MSHFLFINILLYAESECKNTSQHKHVFSLCPHSPRVSERRFGILVCADKMELLQNKHVRLHSHCRGVWSEVKRTTFLFLCVLLSYVSCFPLPPCQRLTSIKTDGHRANKASQASGTLPLCHRFGFVGLHFMLHHCCRTLSQIERLLFYQTQL